ncbi:MAG: hypothetical protein K1X35_00115 [Caulobacteraceae bacterium]|nr:hypothetical protein [Caulobacteraceae bacterium]
MRRVTLAALLATAMTGSVVAAAPVLAAPQPSRDIRADRRATAESIAAQYAAEQFRAAQIGDETTRQLLAQNEAQRRRIAAVLRDARATAAQRDAAKAQLAQLDAQLKEVNARLLATQQAGDELKAQLREYQRQITDAVENASPEVAAAYELYAQGDRDTAYEVIDRLSQAEAAAAKRAGEIRAGALMRRPAVLSMDRKDRGEMTTAQVIDAWARAQAADPEYHRGWIDLTNLQMEAGRVGDARRSAEEALRTAETEVDKAISSGLIGDVMLAAGDVNGARKRWADGVLALDAVPAASPDHDKAEEATMAILDRLGDLYSDEYDYAAAAGVYTREIGIARSRAAASDAIGRQRDLLVALAKMADAYGAAENPVEQKKALEELLAVSARVLATSPGNLAYLRDYSMAELKLADFLITRDRPRARTLIADGLAIARRIAAADPTSAQAKRDVAVAVGLQAGLVWREQGQFDAYKALMQESLKLHRELVASDPSNEAARQDLALRLYDYSQALGAREDYAGARVALEEQLGLYRQAAASQTAYGHDYRRVAGSLAALALVVERQSGLAAAKPYYDEMLTLRRKLVAENLGNILPLKDLGAALIQLGDAQGDAADWTAARASYREAQEILEKAFEIDKTDSAAFRDLGMAHQGLGLAAYYLREDAEVFREFRYAEAIFDQLIKARPSDPEARRDLWVLLFKFARMADDHDAWSQVTNELERARSDGLLDPADEKFLIEARKQLAAHPAPPPTATTAPAAAPSPSQGQDR